MNKFVRNLLTEWRVLDLPVAGETFVIAVSGGGDSMSLAAALFELRRLKKLDLRFVAAHFNHDLRGEESDADERFVREFAAKYDFELVCGKIRNSDAKIQNQAGNLEQNARFARYDFLFETAENLRARAVLTAHTLNDQAETFLLNLIRGSGLSGLRAMSAIGSQPKIPASEYENDSAAEIEKPEISLVRPFLNWATRERTESFCLENRIEFRFDSMNENLAYRRVQIRKVLLPLLADFNPKIVETLAKTANLLREDYAQLQKTAVEAAEGFRTKSSGDANTLELKELRNLFPSMRRQILREWLKTCRGGNLRRLDSKHLDAIESLIASRKSGRQAELPGGEIVVKNGGRLIFGKPKVEKTRAGNYNQRLDSDDALGAIENNE